MKTGQAVVQLASEETLKKLVGAIRFTYQYTYQHAGLDAPWPSVKTVRRPSNFSSNPGMKTWKIDIDLAKNPTLDPRVLSTVIGGFYNALPEAEQGEYESQHGTPLKGKSR